MVAEAKKLNITDLGQCCICKQYFVMTESWIPAHTNLQGDMCRGSKYSSIFNQYRVDSLEQAIELAQLITSDNSVCLVGGERHSMACADGVFCAEERKLRMQALARYFLNTTG